MSDGFVHSVRVPRLYKVTAKTVQTVVEDGASLKELVYAKKHPVSTSPRDRVILFQSTNAPTQISEDLL